MAKLIIPKSASLESNTSQESRTETAQGASRKNMEEALRESERHYHNLFAAMDEGFALGQIITGANDLPCDYRFLEINSAYEKFIGLDREQIIGKLRSAIPVILNQSSFDAYAKTALTGEPRHFENYNPTLKKYYSVRVYSPKPRQFAAIFTDITAKKQADQSLRESEEEYRKLVENANSIIIKMDNAGTVTFFNVYAQNFFGYSPEEIIGKNIRIIIPISRINEGNNLEKMIDGILKDPDDFSENTNQNIKKNGEIVWISWRNRAIKDNFGKITGNLAIGQDITERKKLENLLQAKSKEQEVILDSAPSMIFYKDKKNRFLRVNKAFGNSMGLSKEQLEGKSLFDIYPKDQADAYWKDDLGVIESGVAKYGITESMNTPQGTRIVHTDKIPYLDEQGNVIGIIGFVIDITEQKLAQQRASKLNRMLKALSNADRAAIDADSEESYLNDICKIIIKDCGYALVWIGYSDNDEAKSVRPVAWAGFENGYLENLNITWSDIDRGHGPTGTAIRTGKPYSCANMLTDPAFEPWRQEALKRGYASSLALPLSHSNACLGAITIYSPQPDAFSNNEVELLKELADRVTNGIFALRLERAKKQAEESFKVSELKYRRLFESAKDGILILDFETGMIVDVNPFLIDLLGYSYDDLLKKHPWDIGPLKDILSSKDAFWELQKNEFIRYEDLPLETKDGKKMLAEFVSNVYLVDRKKVIQCNIRDITGRKQAEENLRKTNQRLAIISYTANRLLTSENPQLVIQDLCQKVMEFLDCQTFFNFLLDDKTNRLHLKAGFGVPPETIRSLEWLAPEDAACGCVARDGNQIVCDHVQESQDAKTKLVRSFGVRAYACHPLLDQGRVIGTLSFGSTSRDSFSKEDLALMRTVTDQVAIAMIRVRSQEALRESEEKFRQIADAMPNLVWTAKPDGNIEYANLTFRYYTGIAKTNGPIWNVLPLNANDRHLMEITRKRAAKLGRPYQLEQKIRRSDGNWRWHLTRCVPIIANGIIVKWYGTATDIDDIKIAAEKLRQTDEEKSKFISTMSHELRNPLTPIVTGIELVKSYLDLEPQAAPNSNDAIIREAVSIIDQQAGHITRLLDDMLDISRISSGKIQLKKTAVSLKDNLEHAVEVVTPLMTSQNHRLSVTLPDPSLRVLADPVRLQQIVANLLNNAIKYTPPNGQIWLEASRMGDFAQITVRDTGLGIDKEKIEAIFSSYGNSRGVTPFVSTQGELGIGLKLTKDLVSLHGGTIAATSPGKDQGCEFTVRLRVLPSKQESESGNIPAGRQTAQPTVPLRALVVDDNAGAADMTAKALSFFGHEAKVCYDAHSALDLIRTYQPHIMFIDIEMPGMNGYDLAKALRKTKDQSLKQVKLVAVTGYGQKEDKDRALSAGFDLHLAKPVNMQILRKAINDLIPDGAKLT